MTTVQTAAALVQGERRRRPLVRRPLVLLARVLAGAAAGLDRAALATERAADRVRDRRARGAEGPELGLPRHWAAGTTLGPLVGRPGPSAAWEDVR